MQRNATAKKLVDSVQGRVTTNHKEGAVSKKLMVIALSIVMFSAFATEAWALSFGGGGFRWGGSISCDRVVQGIARKTADTTDLNVSCTLVIKEILAACRNKGKKVRHGQSRQVSSRRLDHRRAGSRRGVQDHQKGQNHYRGTLYKSGDQGWAGRRVSDRRGARLPQS